MADNDEPPDEERDDEFDAEAAAAAAAVAALAALIGDDVERALSEDDEERRVALFAALAVTAFTLAYEQAGGTGSSAEEARAYVFSLRPAFGLLEPDGSPAQTQRMTDIIAHSATSAGTVAAANDNNPDGDVKFEWRTIRDDKVRDLHRPVDGQMRAAGQAFDVGGHPQRYPGHPIGPPEAWINCRCYLVPSTVTAAVEGEAVTAACTCGALEWIHAVERGGAVLVKGRQHGELLALDRVDDTVRVRTLQADGSEVSEHLRARAPLGVRAPDGSGAAWTATGSPVPYPGLREPGPPGTCDVASQYGTWLASTDGSAPRRDVHQGSPGDGGQRTADEVRPLALSDLQHRPECGYERAAALSAAVSEEPWSKWSAADYSIQQWRRACILTMPDGDPESKSTYKLPVRTPTGALNRAGVHAAAARIGQTDAPPAAIAAAKRKLRGLYRQIREDAPDSLKADALTAWEKSTSPPGTHDAPGWITNPRETQRLRTYWTKGEGAAKIAWGSPGDLTRCAKHLAKYILPEHVWGTCQNLHYEALGYWNPESAPQGSISTPENDAAIAAVFAAAHDLEDTMLPPRALFEDPHLTGPTPQTVRASGDFIEYVGHLAAWDTCHTGFEGQCVQAPRTASGYAHFRLGEVETDGGFVSVGHITAGTGHAATNLSAAETVAHYDNTGTVVADVAVGEDDHGIWAHGLVRPGISAEQLHALRAGTPSGDWRRMGGTLELVGALIVNVPGFPIPRPELAAAAGRDLALVAAGVVTTDPNAIDVERIAIAVVDHLHERERRDAAALRVTALRAQINGPRVDKLLAAIGMQP